MSKLVIDIETKNDFRDVGGKANINMLEISVVGVYNYGDDSYRAYEEHEFLELIGVFKSAGTIVGYNIIGFDLPVIQANLKKIDNQFDVEAFPRVDLMYDIVDVIGHRIGLNTVVKATLGSGGKSGTGLDAIKLWKEGNLEDLKKYCLQDVKLTKEVYEHGRKEGKVYFEGWQRKYEVPVRWE